jgi:hypothetical protein
MTLVPTRWWASLFMPSCLLLVALAIGIAWCLWAWRRGRTARQARLPVAWTVGSLAELREEGLRVGRGRATRIMRENGLVTRRKKVFRTTPASCPSERVSPNRLDRKFSLGHRTESGSRT